MQSAALGCVAENWCFDSGRTELVAKQGLSFYDSKPWLNCGIGLLHCISVLQAGWVDFTLQGPEGSNLFVFGEQLLGSTLNWRSYV